MPPLCWLRAVWRQDPAGHGDSFHRNLAQRHVRKVRAGGAEGEVQGDTVAGDYSGRHQGVAAQEADERALFPLLLHVREALERKEQVILFQNRRGFAPMIECHTCGWVPKCKNCDVSLTYHKGLNLLTCHYCGYTLSTAPASVPLARNGNLAQRGFGTEKIEDDVKLLFPEATVARMDLDTTRTRAAYERIIARLLEQARRIFSLVRKWFPKGWTSTT